MEGSSYVPRSPIAVPCRHKPEVRCPRCVRQESHSGGVRSVVTPVPNRTALLPKLKVQTHARQTTLRDREVTTVSITVGDVPRPTVSVGPRDLSRTVATVYHVPLSVSLTRRTTEFMGLSIFPEFLSRTHRPPTHRQDILDSTGASEHSCPRNPGETPWYVALHFSRKGTSDWESRGSSEGYRHMSPDRQVSITLGTETSPTSQVHRV